MQNSFNSRNYSYEVIIYSNPDDIIDSLLSWGYIQNYLIGLHDKDLSPDGTALKPHCHCYFTFRAKLSIPYVAKHLNFFAGNKFTVNSNQIQFIRGSLQDCYNYVLHRYEPDKFQYDESILRCSNIRLFRRSYAQDDNTSYKIICDLESGLSLRSLAQKYGRDFILHYTAYKDFIADMHLEEKNIKPCSSQIEYCDSEV